MKKIFLFLLTTILLLFLSTTTTMAAGEYCRSIGGTCRTVCLSGEEDVGSFDCYQGGVTGGQTCCLPEDQEVPQKSCGDSCMSAAECPPECPACQEQVQGQGKVCRVAGEIEPAPPGTGCEDPDEILTAIGCINVKSPEGFVGSVLKLAIGIGGGIAMLLIIFGGIQILTSGGNPDKIQAGKELITSAIAGLILIVFSVFILRIIGVEILKIF